MPGKKAKKEQPAKEGAGKEGGEGGEGKPYPGADSIIHELELQRLTEKVEGLEKENQAYRDAQRELKSKLDSEREDHDDIYALKQSQLEDQSQTITELERRLAALQEERDEMEERTRKELEAVKEKAEAENSRLQDQLARKEKELDTLDEFKARKKEMEETIGGLREQLREASEEHERKIADMERQSVQEKERLKREMLIKVKETKQNLLSMTEDQLHMTTKRTILENEQMSSELQYQSKQTEQLLQRNTDLTERNNTMKQEIALHKQTEQEMATRTRFYQRLIKKLNQRVETREEDESKVEDQLQQEREAFRSERAAHEAALEQMQKRAESLEQAVERVTQELDGTRRRLARVAAEQEEEQAGQDDTVSFLLTALDDVRNQLRNPGGAAREQRGEEWLWEEGAPAADRSPAPARLCDMSASQRERVLAFLVAKMHAFRAHIATGAAGHSTRLSSRRVRGAYDAVSPIAAGAAMWKRGGDSVSPGAGARGGVSPGLDRSRPQPPPGLSAQAANRLAPHTVKTLWDDPWAQAEAEARPATSQCPTADAAVQTEGGADSLPPLGGGADSLARVKTAGPEVGRGGGEWKAMARQQQQDRAGRARRRGHHRDGGNTSERGTQQLPAVPGAKGKGLAPSKPIYAGTRGRRARRARPLGPTDTPPRQHMPPDMRAVPVPRQ